MSGRFLHDRAHPGQETATRIAKEMPLRDDLNQRPPQAAFQSKRAVASRLM